MTGPTSKAPNKLAPAEQAMVYDLLTVLVRDAANPERFAQRLCEMLRELTGARTVVAAGPPSRPGQNPQLTAVTPSRRRELAESAPVGSLLRWAWSLDAPTLWERDEEAEKWPDGPCIGVPFSVGDRRVGVLFLMELPGLDNARAVLDVLTAISPTISLAFSNALLLDERARHLHERTAQLRASEARFQAIAERAFDMILVGDEDGRLVYCSPAIEETLGYQPEKMIGRLLAELAWEGDYGEVLACLADIAAGNPVTLKLLRLRRRDGSRAEIEINAGPVERGGEIVGIQLIGRDVTHREESARARMELERQLSHAQRLESIGRLAGGVAHDFNNMLSVVLSSTSFLRDGIVDRVLLEDVAQIEQAGNQAASLTRQLLAFSRKQLLRPEVHELNGIVKSIDEMLRRLIGEDIDLLSRLGGDVGLVRVDRGQIEQILMNLAVNARDAMPRGGHLTLETANIELDEQFAETHAEVRPGPYVQLAVSDTGTGIDSETLVQIFEPFFSTKSRDEGTGLGLSTVHGIVKQSGGHIFVYSEVGVGTTFKVYLPRVDASPTATDGPRALESYTPDGLVTVLLVEDEVSVRRAAARILRRGGYRVLEAGDGPEAEAIAGEHGSDIDILLTDIILPGPTGCEVAERLLEDYPALHVVYVSGYTNNAIEHAGVHAVDRPFIQKPFTTETLLETLGQLLKPG